ncbi:hypothetical protein WL94_15445 [Burkholderia cepacia]|uniref:hypothetical protein n=1 Tax=Burkholderia cepacia TaxID=292 RepID=UPI0007567566|nr:hypothetical protein [Burkholderia cepacia]KWF89634.1 hypothetical protein WL94_15445 [Burkholderia cepacia]
MKLTRNAKGLGSVHAGAAKAPSWGQDAVDAAMYFIAAGAGDDASTDESCCPTFIDSDDIRPCRELPPRFAAAISAHVL